MIIIVFCLEYSYLKFPFRQLVSHFGISGMFGWMICISEVEPFRIFRKLSKEFSVAVALVPKVSEFSVERKALVVLS